MNVDAAGVVHEGDTGLPRLYAVANAPIFSYDDAFFGREIVGGPMHSVVEGSRATAAVAIRILGGEKAGDIKIPAHRICDAEIRLEGNAALGHQREPPAAGKRDSLSRSDRMGPIPCADPAGLCRVSRAVRIDLLAALRAEETPPLRSRSAELGGRLINAPETERARPAREMHDDVT